MLFTMISLCLFTSMPSFMLWRTVMLQWGKEESVQRVALVRGLRGPRYLGQIQYTPVSQNLRNLSCARETSRLPTCESIWRKVPLIPLSLSHLWQACPLAMSTHIHMQSVIGNDVALQTLNSGLERAQREHCSGKGLLVTERRPPWRQSL